MNKRYRLLKDLPDGSKIGDEYLKGEYRYYNKRMHDEAKGVIESVNWETWQVENNSDWFELISETNTIRVSKEVSAFIVATGTAVDGGWFHLPFWYHKVGEDLFEYYTFDKLPEGFKKELRKHRGQEDSGSFQWTDELVLEFCGKYSHDLYKDKIDIDSFKKSKSSPPAQNPEASKDWEIVLMADCFNAKMRQGKTGMFRPDIGWGEFSPEYIIQNGGKILQVRRLSDGVVFTVGVIYQDSMGRVLKPIKKFLIERDVMYAQFDEGRGNDDGCLGINSLRTLAANRINTDNICPATKQQCDDECCTPGSICNLSQRKSPPQPEQPKNVLKEEIAFQKPTAESYDGKNMNRYRQDEVGAMPEQPKKEIITAKIVFQKQDPIFEGSVRFPAKTNKFLNHYNLMVYPKPIEDKLDAVIAAIEQVLNDDKPYSANFLWGFADDSIETAAYEFANAKTEKYQQECWNELKRMFAQELEDAERKAFEAAKDSFRGVVSYETYEDYKNPNHH